VIELTETAEIDRPPADVFERLTQLDGYSDWLPGIKSITRDTDEPLTVDTPLTVEFSGPTGPIRAAGTITELVPAERLAFAAESPQLRFSAAFDLASATPNTTLTLQLRIELKGGLRFAERLLERQAKPELGAAIARLRAQVESSGNESGSRDDEAGTDRPEVDPARRIG
jgi:carbon monoxide dehydrogenase subunit G